MKIKEVENVYQANYLIGEEFGLPEDAVQLDTLDMLLEKPVCFSDGSNIGEVVGFTETPDYILLTVKRKDDEVFLPLKDEIAEFDGEKVIVLKGDVFAY